MSSTRKFKMLSKHLSKVNEQFPDKKGASANGSRIQKRKFSDLDSHWSEEELELFYEAYRKYGKDWKEVANAVCSRSLKMVEALYNLNRAYLSLPEGQANAAGFIAMMTDYYNNLEWSDDDRECRAGLGPSRKPQKHIRGVITPNMLKGVDGPFCDTSAYQSASSSYGCLPLSKGKCPGGSQPRAVGKRTPHKPVSLTLNVQHPKFNGHVIIDEGVHVDALELPEGFHRGCSLLAFRSPASRRGHMKSSVLHRINKNDYKDEAENNQFGHIREACSGAEEAVILSNLKGENDSQVFDGKVEEFSTDLGKRNGQLFFGDESAALDALRILANLSVEVLGPYFDVEPESSVQVKEDQRDTKVVENLVLEELPLINQGDGPKILGKKKIECTVMAKFNVMQKKPKPGGHLPPDGNVFVEEKRQPYRSTRKVQKRKPIYSVEKVVKAETHHDSHFDESWKSENKRSGEVVTTTQQSMQSRPSVVAQMPLGKADRRALSELTSALDKKVTSAHHCLRQGSSHQTNTTSPCLNSMENAGGSTRPFEYSIHYTFVEQNSGLHLVEIVESSRQKARTMVDVAVKAMFTVKGENALVKVKEALDSMNKWDSIVDSGMSAIGSIPPSNSGHGISLCDDKKASCKLEPTMTNNFQRLKRNASSDGNEAQLLSKLISSCVATFLMIQACTCEKEYPPADVALILDSAIASLQPCCALNVPIYREIEQCIDIVKNQMSAKIPTTTTTTGILCYHRALHRINRTAK